MIPLLKIRFKYFKNHLLSFIIFHIIIPIALFIYAINIDKTKKPNIFPKTGSYIKGEYYLFPNDNDKYKNLKFFLEELSLISTDENECKSLSDFMMKEANQTFFPLHKKEFKCYKDEKDLPYDEDGILIIKNKEKYEFQLIKHNSYALFDYRIISTENNIDIFNVEKLVLVKETKYNSKYSVYLELQSLLVKYLIQKKYGQNITDIDKNMKITVGTNPYPPHTDYYLKIGQKEKNMTLLVYSFIVSFIFSLYSYFFNMRMIEEKEQKLDIFLKRYGISNFIYILTWFIIFLCMNFLPIIDMCILCYNYLPYHLSLFVFNIILYVLSLFFVSYFFYICIPSVKVGNTIIKFYNLGLCILGCAIILDFVPRNLKIFFSIIPQINVFHCTYAIIELQTFDKLSSVKLWLKANKIPYMQSILMYIFDIFLYLFISILIQTIKKDNYILIYLFKSLYNKSNQNNIINNDLLYRQNDEESHQNFPQPESSHPKELIEQNKTLKILNLFRSYEGKNALNNFNAEFYPSEIFCLLGLNGSGKSTLLNIISGIINPNFGDIIYDDISINKNKDYFIENISMCPQENLFFDFLTVSEYLKLMQKIKTGTINIVQIYNLLNKLDLLEKENYQCRTLSSNQKRKLCIALSLISDSPIILLDQPTNGMDIESKKNFYKIINLFKKNKIILITTDSIEEAEILGDKIGIISEGNLICSGKISFLKEKYPYEFTINIILNNKNRNNKENYQKVIEKVKILEPEIEISYNEMISLKIKTKNKDMEKLFQCLEEYKEECGIEDYLIKSTNLEDIFFKKNEKYFKNLSQIYENKNVINNNINNNNDDIDDNDDNDKDKIIKRENNVYTRGLLSQIFSQLKRIIIPFRRNIILFFFELFLSLLAADILYLLFFEQMMMEFTRKKGDLDFIKILEANKNYIYDKNNYLKKSYCYSSSKNIHFQKIKNSPNNITEFMEKVYEESFSNIAKGSISIKNYQLNNKTIYDVYNTEIFTGNYGNVYANTMLLVSAFLKNEYNIDASIITKIKYEKIRTKKINFTEIMRKMFSLIIIILCTIFGFLFFLTGLTIEKITERKNNVKHLIYLSGGNLWSYWIAYFIFDLIKIMIFSLFLLISVSSVNNISNYISINMCFSSISSLFLIYFISYFCSKEDSVIKFILIYVFINLGIGLFFQYEKIEEKYPNLILEKFIFTSFDLNPITSMGFSMLRIIYHYCAEPTIYQKSGIRPIIYAVWNSFTIQLFNIILYGSLFFLVESGYFEEFCHYLKNMLILKEKNYFSPNKRNIDINDDIGPILLRNKNDANLSQTNSVSGISMVEINNEPQKEGEIKIKKNIKKTVKTIDINNIKNIKNDKDNNMGKYEIISNQYSLNEFNKLKAKKGLLTSLEALKKIYLFCFKKNILAVNNLYLCLELNEKIALLGKNGSGKTTIFKMITKELLYDTGAINIFGYDNKKNFNKINSIIGYCPQENIIFENMKVKEIIKFFSELKINNETTEKICSIFGLNNYINTYCSNLSCGNKRKLALAIAFMNKPNLLLLDEPCTGMDPISKKIILNNIYSYLKDNQNYNLILSTNSIEEAEILSDRISYLKNGNYFYLGNINELKKPKNNNRYLFYIKFDKVKISINNDENITEENIQQKFKNVSDLSKSFNKYSEYFYSKPELGPQLEELYHIINAIKEDINNLETNKFENNNSYEFFLEINRDHKKILFCKIIDIKNNSSIISEIGIRKESLDNILESLK